MKKISLTIGILTLTALAGVFWYLQSEEDETKTVSVVNNAKDTVTQEVQEVQKVQKTEILTEENGSDTIDTSDWKTYEPITGIEVVFPENWYHVQPDTDYRFVSNKKYSKLDLERFNPSVLRSGEVRVQVGISPMDIDPNFDLDTNLSNIVKQEKNKIQWSCENIYKKDKSVCEQYKTACSSTEIQKKSNKHYAVISCSYSNAPETYLAERHVLKSVVIFQTGNDVLAVSMTMSSYDKNLLDKKVFDKMFNDLKEKVLLKYMK